MDKFGIFSLLNSFSSLLNKGTTENSNANETISSAETKNETNLDVPFAPLQAQMVQTITSHDEFVKRVMKNNARNKSPIN